MPSETADLTISIHALVKRATYRVINTVSHCLNFNPRPREEGDPIYGILACRQVNFNPRPREEGDYYAKKGLVVQIISIHALVKRATMSSEEIFALADISIHALVKRATQQEEQR